jgi:hypothetical protein
MKRQLIAAAIAIALSCGVQAKTANLFDTSGTAIDATAAFAYTGTNLGTSFSDILNFNLAPSSLWNVGGGAQGSFLGLKFFNLVVGQGLTTLNVEIFGPTGSSWNSPIYSDTLPRIAALTDTLSVSIPTTLLAGGKYEARVWGTSVDTRFISGRPSYTFSLNAAAAPVPEPGEWALMLAGLGMMGFIVRRRQALNG